MYGRTGYGSQLPYGLGGAGNVYNLSGVSAAGYGPYLGNLFDDIQKIASKVGLVSGELSDVASGEKKIGTFDPTKATLMLPVGGSPVATSIPLLPLALGAAALLYFGMSGRRRRS